MILTDEEIEKCRELAFHAAKKSQQSCKGQQVTPSDDYEYQFAWAIEAAILTKLNSAEPVAIVTDYTQGSYQRKYTIAWKKEVGVNARLYLHPPAPSAPEGFTLVPNEPTMPMLIELNEIAIIVAGLGHEDGPQRVLTDGYKAMLAAAPKGG